MTVESEVSKAELRVAAVEAAADECAHTCEEFRQHKWLGEVIVSASVQAFYPLLDQTSSREHQNRSFNPPLAQFAADFEATEVRQANIEKNGVVGDVRAQLKRLRTRFRHVHRVGIFPQGTPDETGDLPLVFDQENTHRLVLHHRITTSEPLGVKKSANLCE